MSKKLTKITSLFLSVVLLLPLLPYAANATPAEQAALENEVISILDDFHTKSQQAQKNENRTTYSMTDCESNKIRKETVQALQDAGYEAYDVTRDSFEQVEQALCTDLDAIGLSKDYSYIIVISGENAPSPSTRDAYGGTPGSSFSYTYNGTTYTMRYMTVTAANVPAYGKVSTVNLLESRSRTVIMNCLNTVITTFLDAAWSPLGTVASLLGFDISNFAPDETASLTLNAATNWTRVFTQVLDPYDEGWFYGSSVEYAKTSCYLSGYYYKASTNAYTPVNADERTATEYSEHFYDAAWRKRTAIDSLFAITTYDTVGPIKYAYGSVVKVTHELNYY